MGVLLAANRGHCLSLLVSSLALLSLSLSPPLVAGSFRDDIQGKMNEIFSSATANYVSNAAGAATEALAKAFARSFQRVRSSKLVRDFKYMIHPPSTDPTVFNETVNSIGGGFVSYLGCMDRLNEEGRKQAVEELTSQATCGHLVRSLSRFAPFSKEETAFRRLEVLQDKFEMIRASYEGPVAKEGASKEEAPNGIEVGVRAVLEAYEADLDKHFSILCRSLLSAGSHEKAKLFLRRMGPLLLQSLPFAWEAADRLPQFEREQHHKRLAAAARDLSRVDKCVGKTAGSLESKAAKEPVFSYYSTSPLTPEELKPKKTLQQLQEQEQLLFGPMTDKPPRQQQQQLQQLPVPASRTPRQQQQYHQQLSELQQQQQPFLLSQRQQQQLFLPHVPLQQQHRALSNPLDQPQVQQPLLQPQQPMQQQLQGSFLEQLQKLAEPQLGPSLQPLQEQPPASIQAVRPPPPLVFPPGWGIP